MPPLGVLFIAVFMIFIALIGILSGSSMMLFKEEVYPVLEEEFKNVLYSLNVTFDISNLENLGDIFSKLYDAIAIGTILIGMLYLIGAIGLLMLKNWARILTMVLFGFEILYSLFTIQYDLFALFTLVLSILVIVYLMQRNVGEKFGRRKISIEDRILGQKP
ncbi:MAG: hypothetical protein QXN34_05435 [Archaeoglobaceae archaeon]